MSDFTKQNKNKLFGLLYDISTKVCDIAKVTASCTTTRETIAITAGEDIVIPADDNVIGWVIKALATGTVLIDGTDFGEYIASESYSDPLATTVTVTTATVDGVLVITRKICV